MADRPILFSAPMVRALLAGRKTQTRRIPKAQPINLPFRHPMLCEGDREWPIAHGCSVISNKPHPPEAWIKKHIRIKAGDRLYVREHWRTHDALDELPPRDLLPGTTIEYATDPNAVLSGKHRQAMHMPRWASRVTLIVTDVRVERLQDISEKDAEAEGVEWETADPPFCYVPGIWPHSLTGVGVEHSRTPFSASYFKLWDYINGLGAAALNPWVSAYTFTVIKQNIDQIEKVAA